jgi:hypothetical protein
MRVFLFILVFCLIGCKDKSNPESKTDFEAKAFDEFLLKSRRANYGFVSKETIDTLKMMAQKAEKGKLKKLVNAESGQVNIEAFADYIKQPKEAVLNAVSESFNVNFFFENSASMDGYISSDNNDFKNAIFGLLTNLKNNSNGAVKNLKLNHINAAITHTASVESNAVLDDFILRLNPKTFRELGIKNHGNRGFTDMHELLKMVLEKADTESVAILVSDFILSPPKNMQKDAAQYINSQRAAIMGKFSEKKRDMDLVVYMLKMESEFAGTYYDRVDKPTAYKGKRPYYIWFIGSPLHVAKIAQNKSIATTMELAKHKPGESLILESYKGGMLRQPEFNLVKKTSNNKMVCIPHNAKRIIGVRDTKNFNCSMDISFNDSFRGPAFYRDLSNYKVEGKNDFEIAIGEPKDKEFELNLALSAEKVNWGEAKISVMDKMPNWVKETSSQDDSNFKTDASQWSKTYNFEELATGVFRGFYPEINPDVPRALQTISVNIQKEK